MWDAGAGERGDRMRRLFRRAFSFVTGWPTYALAVAFWVVFAVLCVVPAGGRIVALVEGVIVSVMLSAYVAAVLAWFVRKGTLAVRAERAGELRAARARQGLCPACGYDLTGNTSGRCSECGETVNADRRVTA
jgi:ABC-type dipeptide/oligopeptide/nickel transport system permease component